MPSSIRVAGAYKAISKIHVRAAGVWKEVQNGYVRVGGVWKQFHAGIDSTPKTIRQIIEDMGLAANLKLLLDAGDAASYTSGQKWLDRSGGGFDFNRGTTGSASADDPTFSGVAGGMSAAEYWTFDGGDFFSYDQPSAESWMSAFHQDNAAWSFIAGVYLETGGTVKVFGSNDFNIVSGSTPGVAATVADGFNWLAEVSNDLVVAAFLAGGTPNANAWNFVGASINEATGNVVMKTNGSTTSAGGFSYSNPSAGATAPLKVGSQGITSPSHSSAGTRIAFLAMWSQALTSNQLDDLYAQISARRGYGF